MVWFGCICTCGAKVRVCCDVCGVWEVERGRAFWGETCWTMLDCVRTRGAEGTEFAAASARSCCCVCVTREMGYAGRS
jgi:hypothetical protein